MGEKVLSCIFAVIVAFSLLADFVNAEGGNICNRGCELSGGCSGNTPYLCKGGWLDVCVAKGFDGGYCGGKTDTGGYCFECSAGCVSQAALGEKCGLFAGCKEDEYCCKRAEWFAGNVCKPKYADMGCCGGPPAKGDRITFLKATIANNKDKVCTSKINWEVKSKGSASFVDYSSDCVEGRPDIKIDDGKSLTATCTSQKLPQGKEGHHTAKVSWCGESAEFEYGRNVLKVLSVEDDVSPPYETADPTPAIKVEANDYICKVSLEDKNFDNMEENCMKGKKSNEYSFCIPPDTGSPGEKKVYIACRDIFDSNQVAKIVVPFTLLEDKMGLGIIPEVSPSYGYGNPTFLIKVRFIDLHRIDMASIKTEIIKDGVTIGSPSLISNEYLSLDNMEIYNFEWTSIGQTSGKYNVVVTAKDTLGNFGEESSVFWILKSDNKFKIYAVAANYDDMVAYKNNAQKEMQKFKDVSPFKEPECKNGLGIIILDKNCKCSSVEAADTCSKEIIDCVEKIGITDYDVIMAFTDDKACDGYSLSATVPFAMCYVCSNSAEVCATHELGHQFKLCEEYSYARWMSADTNYKKRRLLAENLPYSGCGNPYPEKNGIGKPNVCDTDCNSDSSVCQEGTCGVKIGGDKPPYDTGIMGYSAAWKKDVAGNVIGMVANPIGYGTNGYDFILKKIKEAGYCG